MFGSGAEDSKSPAKEQASSGSVDEGEETTQQGRFLVSIDWTAHPAVASGGEGEEEEEGGESGAALSYWAYLSSRHDLMVNREKQLLLYGKLREGSSRPPASLFTQLLVELESHMNQ